MKFGIIIGSIREGRAAESVAQWVKDQADLRDNADVSYELVDLKDYDVPLNTSATVPGAANKQYEDPAVTRWSEKIDSLDGYIFVTPEYNHSVPGPFKNSYDSLGAEWANKPVAFVSYGASGGVRAVEHWRVIVGNMSMFDLRNQIDLNLFTEFNENGASPNERRAGEIAGIFDDLEALTRQLQA